MKKILKLVACATAVSLTASVAVCLSSCGGSYKKVSTVDELYAMQSNKSYKLTCDIDLQNRAWTPLEVKYFDGNGYKISNCNINATLGEEGGFFTRAEKVNNVTFENITGNITLSCDQWENVGIVAGQIDKELKNVTVTESEMTFHVTGTGKNAIGVGGIAGEYRGATSTMSTGITGVYDCKIENTTLSVIAKNCILRAGGIIGSHRSKELSNCTVTNSSISASGGTIGGVIGNMTSGNDSSIIKNCVFEDSEIKTGGATVGGILGGVSQNEKVTLTQCEAVGGTITVNSQCGYTAGGLLGNGMDAKITDCLVGGMEITCSVTANNADAERRAGGLCGSSEGTVANSIVYDSNISGTNYTGAKAITCGFMAKVGGSVNACAVYGVTVSGGKRDIFCPESNAVFNCFAGESGAPNANNVSVLDESGWNDILISLWLDFGIWDFADGKPVLRNNKI